jgi:hypothetical protein
MHAWEAHHYSWDLLLSELVIGAGFLALSPGAGGPRRFAPLFLAALAGPWLSFPSALTLGGGSLALFLDACRRGGRGRWAGFTAVLLASAGGLWYCSARWLYYPGMQEYWSPGFPDLSSAGAAASWALSCLVGLGDYGNTGLGVPLLGLAAVGGWALGRRDPAAAALLAGPVVAGLAAAFLRRYPMNDRTLFFAVPCVWLLAGGGAGAILQALRGRAAWAAAAALCLLFFPGAVKCFQDLFVVNPKTEFRGAFAYVHEHWADGDVLWAPNGEVHEVYYGASDRMLGEFTPAAEVAEVARRRRLWLVYSPPYKGRPGGPADAVRGPLDAAGCRRTESVRFRGLEVVLYEPPAP